MTARPDEEPDEEPATIDIAKVRKISLRDYVVRFCFGAAVSLIAGVIGLVGGYRLSGLFLAFPAILPATLTLLEKREGTAQALSDIRGATLGAAGMIAFAITAVILLRRAPGIALPAALVAWILASLGLYLLVRRTARLLVERRYLPEVPASDALPAMECIRNGGWTISVADASTGGALTALMQGFPGAAGMFRGALVMPAGDAICRELGVLQPDIEGVSPQWSAVARTLACAARRHFRSDLGVGLIAEPRGVRRGAGHSGIAVSLPDGSVIERQYSRDHGPGRNRERDVRMALQLIVEACNRTGSALTA